MVQITDLTADPHWFPNTLDAQAGTIGFARIDRDALSKEAFLDQRMAGSVSAQQTVSLADTIAVVSSQSQNVPAFIFHTSFCCSTLLARALDTRGKSLALKEPDILMGLANALRVNKQLVQAPSQVHQLTQTLFTLLARRFNRDERVLVKPTNTANNLLPLAVSAGAPTLLLYSDLRSFLVSVLKKGEACKSFIRQQYNIFALDGEGLGAIPQRQALGFTDLQIAATVWRHQMESFQRALTGLGQEQLMSLNVNTLMADPATVLLAVAQHLRLDFQADELLAIAQGPVFSRNAKFDDQAYGNEHREQETQLVEQRYSETLDLIETWAGQLNLGTKLQMPLAKAV